MVIPVALLTLGYALLVAGVALASVPAALVVGGVTLCALALFVDFDTFKVKGGSRGKTR